MQVLLCILFVLAELQLGHLAPTKTIGTCKIVGCYRCAGGNRRIEECVVDHIANDNSVQYTTWRKIVTRPKGKTLANLRRLVTHAISWWNAKQHSSPRNRPDRGTRMQDTFGRSKAIRSLDMWTRMGLAHRLGIGDDGFFFGGVRIRRFCEWMQMNRLSPCQKWNTKFWFFWHKLTFLGGYVTELELSASPAHRTTVQDMLSYKKFD